MSAILAVPVQAQVPGAIIPPAAVVKIPFVKDCDYMDPSVCLLPWPNDYFTKADSTSPTGRRLSLQIDAMPRNVAGKPITPTDYNSETGFSPGSAVITKVPGLDTQAAFDKTGLVPITDMARAFDTDQPAVVIDAATGQRQLIWAELDSNPTDPANRVLMLRPGRNWQEGHRYIVALRNLKDADGKTIAPGDGFRVFRDNVPTLQSGVESRRAHMENLFTTLGKAGIDRQSLYLAWDFTVAARYQKARRFLSMRDDAFRQLGDSNLADSYIPPSSSSPKFTVSSVTDYTPAQDSKIARQVQGSVTVPCYLDAPGCPTGSRFLLDSTGLPTQIPGNTVDATFTCNIPRRAIETGEKVRPTLYGHGLFGGQGEVNQGQQKSLDQEFGFMSCATDWKGMATEDVPNVATILTDLSGFPTLADRVQQGMLDFLYLERAMLHPKGFSSDPAFQVGGQSVIDRTTGYYDGNSQGGIIGGALIAVAPDLRRGDIGVPGANYSILLQRSADFAQEPGTSCPPIPPSNDDINTLSNPDLSPDWALDAFNISYSCPLYKAYPNELERQLILGLIQQLWDRAEADGYMAHMTSDPLPNTPSHNVLMHAALGDHQVANVAAEVEARAIGAARRAQLTDPGRSADVTPGYAIPVVSQFPYTGSWYELWDSGPIRGTDTGTAVAPTTNTPPTAGHDPHEEPRNTYQARQQKDAFLRPGGTVIDTCTLGTCHSRGWLDGLNSAP